MNADIMNEIEKRAVEERAIDLDYDKTIEEFRSLHFSDQIEALTESGILDKSLAVSLAEENWIKIKKYFED